MKIDLRRTMARAAEETDGSSRAHEAPGPVDVCELHDPRMDLCVDPTGGANPEKMPVAAANAAGVRAQERPITRVWRVHRRIGDGPTISAAEARGGLSGAAARPGAGFCDE